jgi:hypothetical protein
MGIAMQILRKLIRKYEGKSLLGIPRRRWEDKEMEGC